MTAVLFAAHPARGHLTPLLAIAERLRATGHEASFALSAPGERRYVTERGFVVRPVPPAPAMLLLPVVPHLRGFSETSFAIRVFTAGLCHYGRAFASLVDEIRPGVLAADYLFPGAWLGAELRGLPWAAVYHSGLPFAGPGIPPFGSGLPIGTEAPAKLVLRSSRLEQRTAGRIVRARAALGLTAAADGRSPLLAPPSPWLDLVLSAEELEARRDPLPATTYFVGPCAVRPSGTPAPFPWERLRPGMPAVYLSLGTAFDGRIEAFRALIAALADAPLQLVVAAGRSAARLRSAGLPANVAILVERAPQLDVLARVDAVVTHGGNNTVNETLAAGRPMLVVPFGGEQGDNASRVVHLGAGLRVDPRSMTRAEIRDGVERLLLEKTFRERARAIAASVRERDGAAEAARLLVRLAEERVPLLRPEAAERGPRRSA